MHGVKLVETGNPSGIVARKSRGSTQQKSVTRRASPGGRGQKENEHLADVIKDMEADETARAKAKAL